MIVFNSKIEKNVFASSKLGLKRYFEITEVQDYFNNGESEDKEKRDKENEWIKNYEVTDLDLNELYAQF